MENANGHFKTALDQALRLHGSRDFATEADYDAFVIALICKHNLRHPERWAEERGRLGALPGSVLPAYDETEARVTRSALVGGNKRSYSVPSRWIGQRLRVRLREREVVILCEGGEVARHSRVSP